MDPEALVGQHIDQFMIERHIAQGSVADVYQAVDVGLKRYVALKVMRANISYDEALASRFQQEAQAIARVDHHNIIQIYMAGVTSDDQPYLAMQYIDGGTLRQKLEQLALHKHKMPAAVALDIAKQVVDALDMAHNAGIVHGNLKPSNILLRDDAEVVVSDLRVPTVHEATTRMMMRDQVIGDSSYMSPEQRRGRKLDGRSDIYALGLILYEMLAGKQPKPSLVKLRKVRPELSEMTYRLVENCLQDVPDARYQTTGELMTALDHAIRDEGLDKIDPSPFPVRRGLIQRGNVWVIASLSLILGSTALIATGIWRPFSGAATETPTSVLSRSGTEPAVAPPANSPTPTIAPTDSPIAATQASTATPLPPTVTPTPEPSTPTATPLTPTLEVTAVPTTICPNPIFFLPIWQVRSQLGCPMTALTTDFTSQFFEGGVMTWQKSPMPAIIYAIFNDGTWQQQTDPGGPPVPSCPEAEQHGDVAPIFGFGVTWCNTPIWQEKLGAPTTGEQGASNKQVQLFENGTIISVGQASNFILYTDGRWERFAGVPVSPTPTPIPTPAFCLQLPSPRWVTTLYFTYQNRLGCPLSGEISTQAAYQLFQSGLTVWRDDLNIVYVLYNDATYAMYDVSAAIDQEYGENLKGSFGWLWSNNAAVRGRLGNPSGPESIGNDFVAQDFVGGTIFYFRENYAQNYVLLADQTVWTASN